MSRPTFRITRLTKGQAVQFLPALNKAMKHGGEFVTDPQYLEHVWIAHSVEDEKLAAFAGIMKFKKQWCYAACLVLPEYRGMGLQKRLTAQICGRVWSMGHSEVIGWVRLINTASVRNLLAEGFNFVSERPRELLGKPHFKMRKYL